MTIFLSSIMGSPHMLLQNSLSLITREVYILGMAIIKFEQLELIPKRYFFGHIEIEPGFLTKICGNNGVGNSTLFTHFQSHQKKYFSTNVIFLDQQPLNTLNDYTLEEIKKLLLQYWSTHLIAKAEHNWEKMIHEFQLPSKQKLSYLSGGQNQLVKLMLTSLVEAGVYFLDEPFTALDHTMVLWWKEWMHQCLAENKVLVVIDHSLQLNEMKQHSFLLALETMDRVTIKKVAKTL